MLIKITFHLLCLLDEEFKEEMTVELKNMHTGEQNILKLSQFLSDLG